MKNHKTQPTKLLVKAEFNNGAVDYLTDDQLSRISEICKGEYIEEIKGEIESIKTVESFSNQSSAISGLYYELRQSVEILQHLVSAVYKLDVNSKEYGDALNNISYFIHRNIIDESKRVVDELNSVLEYENK